MLLVIIALAAVQSDFVSGQRLCFNWRSDRWCRNQINLIQSNAAYRSNAYYSGNTCLYNARMKSLYCCNLCQEMLGGEEQAKKDVSYMQTSFPCVENSIDVPFCQRQQSRNRCRNPDVKLTCPTTCGYCSQANLFTAAPSCVANFACLNDTYCNVPAETLSGTFTAGTCTQNGGATDSTARGTCESCTKCTNEKNKCPNGDSDCGGAYKSCGPDLGKANDGVCSACATSKTATCVLDAPCVSDQDCGGTVGTCLRQADPAVATYEVCPKTNAQVVAPATAPGACKCTWCPNHPAVCKKHGQACTWGNGDADCGNKTFCRLTTTGSTMSYCNSDVDAAAKCTCQCMPTFTGKDPVPTAQNGDGFPICIQGMKCTKGKEEQCGGVTASLKTPCNDVTEKCVCTAGEMPGLDEVPSLCDPTKTCTLPGTADKLQCVSDANTGGTTPITESNMLPSVCQPPTNASEFICQCDVQVPPTSVRVGATCFNDSVASDPPGGYCPNGTFCSAADTSATVLNTPCTIPKQLTGKLDTATAGCVCADLTAVAALPDYVNNKQKCYSDWTQICGYGDCVLYGDMRTPCTTPTPQVTEAGNAITTFPVTATAPLADTDCVCKQRQCHKGAECALSAPAFGAAATATECGADDTCKGKCNCK